MDGQGERTTGDDRDDDPRTDNNIGLSGNRVGLGFAAVFTASSDLQQSTLNTSRRPCRRRGKDLARRHDHRNRLSAVDPVDGEVYNVSCDNYATLIYLREGQ